MLGFDDAAKPRRQDHGEHGEMKEIPSPGNLDDGMVLNQGLHRRVHGDETEQREQHPRYAGIGIGAGARIGRGPAVVHATVWRGVADLHGQGAPAGPYLAVPQTNSYESAIYHG